MAYLLATARPASLDAVAALDDICLEAYRSGPAMKFQEQATGVAQHGTDLIASPERRRRRGAILACWRLGFVRQSRRHFGDLVDLWWLR